MTAETIVATFATQAEAEDARRELENAGIESSNIEIRAAAPSVSATARASDVVQSPSQPTRERGFFDWLFGEEEEHSDFSADDRNYYRSHLSDAGGAIITIYADQSHWTQIETVLARWNAQPTVEPSPSTADMGIAATAATSAPPVAGTAAGTTAEQVIPTAREELKVGKRQVQDTEAYRVRRYVVERPVEEQVSLRDETVIVERRAPSGTTPASNQPFEEKIVEVTQTREEPVVSKDVKAGEDVVVRKDVRDRVETVRDTVRESKVEIDRAAAGDKPAVARTTPELDR